MIGLLGKVFIKDYENYNDAEVRRKYGMLGSLVGIVLNVLLFGFKYFAGFISGSVAIMADAFNNLSDAGSSIITLVGFKFAGMKPDNEHPFGHGRIEYISGFAVAIAIILMGFELAKTSIVKIIHPQPVDTSCNVSSSFINGNNDGYKDKCRWNMWSARSSIYPFCRIRRC